MANTEYGRILMRRRTSVEWIALNEILMDGEIGIVTDAVPRKLKIGDGLTAWNDLVFTADTSAISAGFANAIPTTTPDPLIKSYNADLIGIYTHFDSLEVTTSDLNSGLVQLRQGDDETWTKVIVPIPLGAYVQKNNNPFGYYGPYASLSLANAAISNTIVDGKNLRDGKIALIGTGAYYIPYSWKGGYANANLVEYSEIHARQTSDGTFKIMDSAGNVVFGILKNGKIAFAGVSQGSEEVIRKIANVPKITVKDIPDALTKFLDMFGNVAVGILKNGTLAFRPSQGTVQYFRDYVIKPMISGNLFDKMHGQKWAFITDSHGRPDGSSGIGYLDTYIGQIENLQGCQVYVNAVAGSNITYENSSSLTDDARWGSLNSLWAPDGIIIQAGANDHLETSPLGAPGDTTRSTFYGALYYLYSKIMAANPTSRVFHMLPFHNTRLSLGVAIPETNGTYSLVQLHDAIRYTAKIFGVAIIDTSLCGVNIFNINTYSPDWLHFNVLGHKLLYKTIINETNRQL